MAKKTTKAVKPKKTTKPKKAKKEKPVQYLEVIEEDKSIGKQAGKIQDPAISVNQIVALLSKTPEVYKYNRPAKGGSKPWTYVSGGYVKKRLNQIFGWAWNFTIVDKFREDNEVIVQGRLTICNKDGAVMIIKEDFGKKEIQNTKGTSTPLSIGNDYKSAATDCLKRCAYQLGLASDVYAPLEYKELENPTEAVYEQKKSESQQYRITCRVCHKTVETDKRFLKECAKCAPLSKAKKSEIINKRNEKLAKEQVPFKTTKRPVPRSV